MAPMTDTMTSPDTDVLRKVRALLDKAEASPFPEEAEAFTAKATEMMARYRIDHAMLEAAKPVQDRGEIIERDINLGSGPYVRARLSLIDTIASSSNCRCLTAVRWEGRVAFIVGYETDVDVVETLYTSLLLQATNAAASQRGTAARRSFLFGFASRIGERLRETNRLVTDEVDVATGSASGSTALVLRDRKADVDENIKNRYGRLRSLSSAAPSGSREGRDAGRAAANNADIGGSAVSAGRKALGS